MKIDGKAIALEMYENLKLRVKRLNDKGLTPHLVVILVGNDPASKVYVGQKEKWGIYIDAKITILHYDQDITEEKLTKIVQDISNDPYVHGLIIQRPLPEHINRDKIISIINPEKDIDGFHPDSPYDVPVALAVMKVLNFIWSSIKEQVSFNEWLNSKKLVVIGRGETAGGPIIRLLRKNHIQPEIISSKTENRKELINNADIVVSAVGRPNIIQADQIKEKAIVIGVGLFRGNDDKLHGDYDPDQISQKASYYTQATGGVGPINVAFLLQNLVEAAEKSYKSSDIRLIDNKI